MRIMMVFLAACATSGDPANSADETDGEPVVDTDTDTEPVGSDEVTWHEHVRPMVDQHCVSCHAEGGVAPFTFDDDETIEVLAPLIVDSVVNGTMPPWQFDAECRKPVDDLTLDPATIATFTDWSADGFLIGDPREYVAPEMEAPAEPRPHDLVAWPQVPFTPDTTKSDHYLCQVTDLVFDEETFLTYTEVIPDRLDLLHHVIVYAVPMERRGSLLALAGGDLTNQFDCWGSPVATLGMGIGGWVPGAETDPQDTMAAMRIPAGSVLVTEMHYNTLAATLTGDDQDNTSVKLWTMDRADVETLLLAWTVYDFELDIPAGEADWDEGALSQVPITGEIVASSPHMHLLGSGLRTELIDGSDATVQCVSAVEYDFDWQRDYVFEHAVEVNAGDTLSLTCTYDNSAGNQAVVNGQRLDPRDVNWGDGSLDEMCIDFLTFAVPFDTDSAEGICGGYDTCFADCPPGDGACAVNCFAQAGGESCYICGAEAMFGGCTTGRCGATMWPLLGCLGGCDGVMNDYNGCLVNECRNKLDAYMDCATPLFVDGTCASDYDGCSGLVP